MRAALDLMTTATGRKAVVLGDMFELGKDSDRLHREVGIYAAGLPIEVLCFIGKNSRHTFEGAREQQTGEQKSYYFEDKDAFLSHKDEILQKGDAVLLKASHGMEFGELVKALQE